MQKIEVHTSDLSSVKRTIKRRMLCRMLWRRFLQFLKRILHRGDEKKRREIEMRIRQQELQDQVRRSKKWREDIALSNFERRYSPRYRRTGELRVTPISNPGFSFDPAQMPTLQETEAVRIEELQS